MGGDRKQVAVCSQKETFSKALRLVLGDFEVHIGSDPIELAAASDLLIWHFQDELQAESLAEVAASTPTLVLAPPDDLIAAVDAGCIGFLSNRAPLEEIGSAVTTVFEGGAVVPPDLLGVLLRHMVQRNRIDGEVTRINDLTAREREVYRLAVEGLRKEEIGKRLYISADTARTHLQRVYRKLGVHSQAELMALAGGGKRTDLEEQ